jgi:4-amino-4-deoxy-L-arabinose transferase-like glycosyltransferase
MEQPGMTDVAATPPSRLAALVDFAQRQPGKVLATVLSLHLAVWTLLPALLSENLQLDLAEGLALGREWQLGYWKLPPLPWWLDHLVHTITGTPLAVYALGPICTAIAIYAVWRLGREIAGPTIGLMSALSLEALHFFNFSAVKFNHDVLQLPFWTLIGLCLYRALIHGRILDWFLTAVLIALAFWTKYTVVVLVLPLAAFVLADDTARSSLRTPGPYIAAFVFALLVTPHIIWLIDNSFLPFHYANERAKVVTHWYHVLTFPLQWTASQLFFLAPTIALMALALFGTPKAPSAPENELGFSRRYVTVLALGPFAVTTVAALVTGRLPVAMWGYPFWSFAPLAALLWFGAAPERLQLRRFAAGFLVFFAAMPLAYAIVEGLEPTIRDRPKATQFPGRLLAETVTQRWRDKFGTPLVYVGGGEFATNNIAVYSADRPHVIVHADLGISPWVDPADLKRRGAVLVWEDGQIDAAQLARLRSDYPGLEVREPLTLPRQVFVESGHVRPVRVHMAFVPPRP